jgi:hypothetical protein
MMVEILGRDRWGARPPAWNPGPVTSSVGVFIHYNGGSPLPASVTSGDFESVAAHLRSVQNHHMGGNGWPDIAYSFCVDAVGRVWELRGWGVAGAHTLNWNWESHAIYLPIGGDQTPTDAQVASCRAVIAEHDRRYGQGFVKGHRQAPNSTSCPGEPTMRLIEAGRFDPSSGGEGDGTVAPQPVDEDDDVKPVIVVDYRTGFHWHVFGNTRYRLESADEVNVLKFLGVPVISEGGDGLVNWLRACKDLGRPKGK